MSNDLCSCGHPKHWRECRATGCYCRKRGPNPNDRWIPPSADRVPIEIHPAARSALRSFLQHALAGTGVGYSEFIMRSMRLWARLNGAKCMASAMCRNDADGMLRFSDPERMDIPTCDRHVGPWTIQGAKYEPFPVAA